VRTSIEREIAWIQSGRLDLRLALTDLATIVREVVEEQRQTHPERTLVLEVREEQQAQLWVRDQGPGLPPEEQELIWDRFYRAQGIEVLSGTGVQLGLGLHVCRTIIEMHHGQVGVRSARGEGSTFWFSLPLAETHPAISG
jgi:signal transduction histidine kinase